MLSCRRSIEKDKIYSTQPNLFMTRIDELQTVFLDFSKVWFLCRHFSVAIIDFWLHDGHPVLSDAAHL